MERKYTEFELINAIPKGIPMYDDEDKNQQLGLWFLQHAENIGRAEAWKVRGGHGFIRCYAVDCISNSADTNAKSGFDPSYGLCMKNANGTKITLNAEKSCVSYQKNWGRLTLR